MLVNDSNKGRITTSPYQKGKTKNKQPLVDAVFVQDRFLKFFNAALHLLNGLGSIVNDCLYVRRLILVKYSNLCMAKLGSCHQLRVFALEACQMRLRFIGYG